MLMNPLHVLVCGTNYGKIYLEAIRLGGQGYRLAGILGRGSGRSQQMAREHSVALYRRVEDLAPGIDLACAAMGASAFDVVLGLLARGIHVVCEHPQKLCYLQSALDAAASRSLCFHINGHFADLEAATAFIIHYRRESAAGPPSFFHVTATDRSLYAALDLLRRVLGSFEPFQFHVTSRLPPFIVVQGFLRGVPITFHIQRCADGHLLADGSPGYLVDHQIAAGFPSGILTLLSMNGPVVWNKNLNSAANPTQRLFAVAHENCALTAELLHKQRIAANLGAIEALAKNICEGLRSVEQTPDYLLEVSGAWETLGSLL
jgi:yersiniabactin synthetase, thiazolinyl reductase component